MSSLGWGAINLVGRPVIGNVPPPVRGRPLDDVRTDPTLALGRRADVETFGHGLAVTVEPGGADVTARPSIGRIAGRMATLG